MDIIIRHDGREDNVIAGHNRATGIQPMDNGLPRAWPRLFPIPPAPRHAARACV
ncbi:hypothetical protein [Komagataeibacter sp. FNDCF1]|uniref:hypothetical protein n=1 Tax=Komagataeibacter sp. FNDCF1 TaxID=2878681 RepID=UPI001E4ABCF9|nr:hypothetical protein [Komagataeibacter sp. FNDCF1]MCE2563177.1 hypothetical protein [Komagataeibacter sp. FNDCF1]